MTDWALAGHEVLAVTSRGGAAACVRGAVRGGRVVPQSPAPLSCPPPPARMRHGWPLQDLPLPPLPPHARYVRHGRGWCGGLALVRWYLGSVAEGRQALAGSVRLVLASSAVRGPFIPPGLRVRGAGGREAGAGGREAGGGEEAQAMGFEEAAVGRRQMGGVEVDRERVLLLGGGRGACNQGVRGRRLARARQGTRAVGRPCTHRSAAARPIHLTRPLPAHCAGHGQVARGPGGGAAAAAAAAAAAGRFTRRRRRRLPPLPVQRRLGLPVAATRGRGPGGRRGQLRAAADAAGSGGAGGGGGERRRQSWRRGWRLGRRQRRASGAGGRRWRG